MKVFQYRLFAHDVTAVARNAARGQEVIFLHRNQQQKLKMPVFCVVYECSNLSNRENTSFYRVRKCVVHEGGKSQEID